MSNKSKRDRQPSPSAGNTAKGGPSYLPPAASLQAAAAPATGGSSPPPTSATPTAPAATAVAMPPTPRVDPIKAELDELRQRVREAERARDEALARAKEEAAAHGSAAARATIAEARHQAAAEELELEGMRRAELRAALVERAGAAVAEEIDQQRQSEASSRQARRQREEKELDRLRAEVEAHLERRRHEAELTTARLQAEAAEAGTTLARDRALAVEAHRRATLDREQALQDREKQGWEAADTLLSEAREEAEAIRDTARGTAIVAVQKARDEAAALLQKARDEAEALRKAATEEIARRGQAASTDANGRLMEADRAAAALRTEADRAKMQAEAAGQRLVAAAELQSEEQIAAAEQEAQARLRRATLEAEALRDERLAVAVAVETSLQAQRDKLTLLETELRNLEATLRAERARQERKAGALSEREADLDLDRQEVRALREALSGREARLGVVQVAALERHVAELEQRLGFQQAHGLELSAERDRLQAALDSLGGADAAARIEEVARLRAQVGRLQVELASSRSPDDIAALQREIDHLRPYREQARATEAERHQLRLAQDDLDSRIAALRAEADRALLGRESAERQSKELLMEIGGLQAALLDKERSAAEMEALRLDRDWLDAERHRLLDQLTIRRNAAEESMKRHYGRLALFGEKEGPLQQLLSDQKLVGKAAPTNGFKLPDLAQALQSRMALHKETEEDRGRRYRIDDVRAFLASLAASRLLVLKGLSGTGKTSLPLYAARALGGVCGVVKVQSGWRDRMDLVGTYNAFTAELRTQPFSELLYAASLDELKDRPYFIVLDECNLSRVEYYFADLLSELQEPKEEHHLRLLERAPGEAWPPRLRAGVDLVIPKNVWFILTANEDESTFELADKTFDRSAVVQMDEQAPDRVDQHRDHPVPSSVSATSLRSAFRAVDHRLGKEEADWLGAVQKSVFEQLRLGLGNRFPEQAQSFVQVFKAAGGSSEDALDRLVASKVLRRVERERDPNRREAVEAILSVVKTIPGKKAPRSIGLLEQAITRLR